MATDKIRLYKPVLETDEDRERWRIWQERSSGERIEAMLFQLNTVAAEIHQQQGEVLQHLANVTDSVNLIGRAILEITRSIQAAGNNRPGPGGIVVPR